MQQGTHRYQIIGAVVLIALAVILVPALMSLREEPPPPTQTIELPDEPSQGVAGAVDTEGRTAPGALPELSDIPLPAPPPMADLEPIPPAPPPVIPASPAPSAAPDTTSPPAPASSPPPPSPPANTASVPTPPAPSAAPSAPRLGVQAYVVQVGTFVNRDGANGVHDKLKAAGFKVFTEETVVNGKNALRVRVGPELDRAVAERNRVRIASELGLDGVVLRYQ